MEGDYDSSQSTKRLNTSERYDAFILKKRQNIGSDTRRSRRLYRSCNYRASAKTLSVEDQLWSSVTFQPIGFFLPPDTQQEVHIFFVSEIIQTETGYSEGLRVELRPAGTDESHRAG